MLDMPVSAIVELWELTDGESERWIDNVNRIDTPRPCIYPSAAFEKQLTRVRFPAAQALTAAMFERTLPGTAPDRAAPLHALVRRGLFDRSGVIAEITGVDRLGAALNLQGRRYR